jgi:hypothetical protein
LRNLAVHQSAAWPLHGVLILAEDLPWLINQAQTTTDPEEWPCQPEVAPP